MQNLDEATVNRIIKHTENLDFCIMSASRAYIVDLNKSVDENNKLLQQ